MVKMYFAMTTILILVLRSIISDLPVLLFLRQKLVPIHVHNRRVQPSILPLGYQLVEE